MGGLRAPLGRSWGTLGGLGRSWDDLGALLGRSFSGVHVRCVRVHVFWGVHVRWGQNVSVWMFFRSGWERKIIFSVRFALLFDQPFFAKRKPSHTRMRT